MKKILFIYLLTIFVVSCGSENMEMSSMDVDENNSDDNMSRLYGVYTLQPPPEVALPPINFQKPPYSVENLPVIKPAAIKPPHEFQILSYNVQGLPYYIESCNQKERLAQIPKYISMMEKKKNYNIDAIVFQELFIGGEIRAKFIDELRQMGFIDFTELRDDEAEIASKLDCSLPKLLSPLCYMDEVLEAAYEKLRYGKPYHWNGGVLIASRWPIIEEGADDFSVRIGADSWSDKGVVFARIEKTIDGRSSTYRLYGTHLQASYEDKKNEGTEYSSYMYTDVRMEQLEEINNFIDSYLAMDLSPDLLPIDSASNLVVIAGDLNEYIRRNEMFDILNAQGEVDQKNQIDYILTRNDFLQPFSSWFKTIYRSEIDGQNNELSDHKPIWAKFKFDSSGLPLPLLMLLLSDN